MVCALQLVNSEMSIICKEKDTARQLRIQEYHIKPESFVSSLNRNSYLYILLYSFIFSHCPEKIKIPQHVNVRQYKCHANEFLLQPVFYVNFTSNKIKIAPTASKIAHISILETGIVFLIKGM